MNLVIRRAAPEDAPICGEICYDAFHKIATEHNFPPDVPSPERAVGLLSIMFSHPDIYCVVAEQDGRIVGSNCLDERSSIAGLGPITVDPNAQNSQVGRRLMDGYSIRKAQPADLEACNRVCLAVHGHHRGGELKDAIEHGTASVVERGGRITGYATVLAFFGHAVGETNPDLEALIGSAESFPGPGILVPTRNAELFRWCLNHGLRVVQPMTLMTVGLYNEPAGAYLPSILF